MSAGKPIPRAVFEDGDRILKIWRSDYVLHRTLFVGRDRVDIDIADLDGTERLPGHLFGLFDPQIAPAYVSGIYCGSQLAGYVMQKGKVLDGFRSADPVHRKFLAAVVERSLKSGFAFRDFKANNIVEMPDGRLSLIDLDTPLSSLAHLSPEQETAGGSLAWFTLPEYRSFIQDWIDPKTTDGAIVAARARMAGEPHLLADAPEPAMPERGTGRKRDSWLRRYVKGTAVGRSAIRLVRQRFPKQGR